MLTALKEVDPKEAEFALSSVTRALLTAPSGGDLKDRIDSLSDLQRRILGEICDGLQLDVAGLSQKDVPRILEALNDALSDIVLSKANIDELEKRTFAGKRTRKDEDRQPKPRIFISSSSEALPLASALRFALEDSAVATVWSDFEAGSHAPMFDTLVRRISSFDFAVLVLAPDDVIESRSQPFSRSNVAFEAGLFVGRLGRDRTFFVSPTKLRLPSDFAGVVTLTYDESLSPESAMRLLSYKIASQVSRFGRLGSKQIKDQF